MEKLGSDCIVTIGFEGTSLIQNGHRGKEVTVMLEQAIGKNQIIYRVSIHLHPIQRIILMGFGYCESRANPVLNCKEGVVILVCMLTKYYLW